MKTRLELLHEFGKARPCITLEDATDAISTFAEILPVGTKVLTAIYPDTIGTVQGYTIELDAYQCNSIGTDGIVFVGTKIFFLEFGVQKIHPWDILEIVGVGTEPAYRMPADNRIVLPKS